MDGKPPQKKRKSSAGKKNEIRDPLSHAQKDETDPKQQP
jgi:hypothetical protein